MTGAAEPARVLFVTSMFRLSRNIGKLLHILEFPLGNGAAVLTTNYLLRRDEAFLRRAIVQVDARAPSAQPTGPHFGLVGHTSQDLRSHFAAVGRGCGPTATRGVHGVRERSWRDMIGEVTRLRPSFEPTWHRSAARARGWVSPSRRSPKLEHLGLQQFHVSAGTVQHLGRIHQLAADVAPNARSETRHRAGHDHRGAVTQLMRANLEQRAQQAQVEPARGLLPALHFDTMSAFTPTLRVF
jgi:hypothetical protein